MFEGKPAGKKPDPFRFRPATDTPSKPASTRHTAAHRLAPAALSDSYISTPNVT